LPESLSRNLPESLSESVSASLFRASLSPREAQQMSPGVLAYIGDAVYELYVRQMHLKPPRRLVDYHRTVVGQVCARRQAQHLQAIEAQLTDTERQIVRRGRNATGRKPRNTELHTYQRATSLEALIGYLYLCDSSRLQEVLSWLDFSANSANSVSSKNSASSASPTKSVTKSAEPVNSANFANTIAPANPAVQPATNPAVNSESS